MEDMRKVGVDTSYLWNEELIIIYAGVYKKPNYNWLKGQHQGRAFEKAYKKPKNQ